ncbi:MAG: DUF1080 domain-containing protein [Candidatus Anammoximicrobium sp.]|nr:DUF1080 domain-containing protein [Candidatus Anammoximicrobium sp.]
MQTIHQAACALAAILAVALAAPNLPAAQEDAEQGWTLLFNGKDLAGWEFYFGKAGTENKGTFTVQEGILICSGRPSGYMVTKKPYGDYTLQVEFAFQRPAGLKDDAEFRGNSGCLIHVGEKNALGVWPRSVEVQGANRNLGIILPIPRDLRCTHTFDSAALARVLRPVGQFNKLEIDVRGGDMTISLNGAAVSTVRKCELTAGPIGIQSEGAETHWKTIRIRER